jgi:hypothetical protein
MNTYENKSEWTKETTKGSLENSPMTSQKGSPTNNVNINVIGENGNFEIGMEIE